MTLPLRPRAFQCITLSSSANVKAYNILDVSEHDVDKLVTNVFLQQCAQHGMERFYYRARVSSFHV